MRIGIPKEIKICEGRVALTPSAAGELVRNGHEVWLQSGAGVASGYADADYATLGVKILPEATAIYERAELVLKVKEPIASNTVCCAKTIFFFLPPSRRRTGTAERTARARAYCGGVRDRGGERAIAAVGAHE